MALEQDGQADRTIFVGHELTARSRQLLETGTMDDIISHDLAAEVAAAVRWITERRNGQRTEPRTSPILVHTRYNRGA